jgi:hemolysin III
MTDHIGIYLLIAGTYTPIMLTLLWDDCGWCLLGLVWTLAAVGITRILVTTTCSWQPYVGMGWMALLAIKPIFTSAPVDGVFWLVIGGLLYTLGVPFFVGKKRLSHAVWHLFVIAGSICHYLAVIVCVQAAR